MSKLLKVYNGNPDHLIINQIADKLENGGIIIFPTDSYYSFGCSINCPKAINELVKLKNKSDMNLSIICSDIKMASQYITISDEYFKILKRNTPKPITFLFGVNKRLPNSFIACKKTVGVRVVDNPIAASIAERLGVPIVSTTVSLKDATREDSIDPSLIWDEYRNKIDILVDGGIANGVSTTVVDMTGDEIIIVRESEAVVE